MHEEAPGADRLQPLQRGAHPILLVDGAELRRIGRVADHRPDQVADVILVRRVGEIRLEAPRAAILVLEGRDRGLGGVEHLAQQVGHRPGRPFVGQQAQDVGRAVGRQAFEHGTGL